MHIIHGYDDYIPWYVILHGYNNGYIIHTKMWMHGIYGKIRHLLTMVCGHFPGPKADLGQNCIVVTECMSCKTWHSLSHFPEKIKSNFYSNPPLPAKKELKLLYNLIIYSVSIGRIVPLFWITIFIKYI